MWHGTAKFVHMHRANALGKLEMISSLTFQRYSAGNLKSMKVPPSDLYDFVRKLLLWLVQQ